MGNARHTFLPDAGQGKAALLTAMRSGLCRRDAGRIERRTGLRLGLVSGDADPIDRNQGRRAPRVAGNLPGCAALPAEAIGDLQGIDAPMPRTDAARSSRVAFGFAAGEIVELLCARGARRRQEQIRIFSRGSRRHRPSRRRRLWAKAIPGRAVRATRTRPLSARDKPRPRGPQDRRSRPPERRTSRRAQV